MLGYVASIKDNYDILNEILNNENFDPVKNVMKILISYDKKHFNCLSFEIYQNCAIRCHKGHKVISNGKTSSFCDCGSDDLKSICK